MFDLTPLNDSSPAREANDLAVGKTCGSDHGLAVLPRWPGAAERKLYRGAMWRPGSGNHIRTMQAQF